MDISGSDLGVIAACLFVGVFVSVMVGSILYEFEYPRPVRLTATIVAVLLFLSIGLDSI